VMRSASAALRFPMLALGLLRSRLSSMGRARCCAPLSSGLPFLASLVSPCLPLVSRVSSACNQSMFWGTTP
jgi:hypothetical protein